MAAPHEKLNRATKAGADAAAYHLPSLTRAYGRALRAAGRRAATRMRQTAPLTAAAEPKQPNWTPPTADQLINQGELADDTQRKTAKLHREILAASARTALEPFGITFDIHAPTSQAVLDQFAERIQTTITSAIAEQVTEAIQTGYANGDSVAKVSRAIQTATDEISRPRADMLARSDLNGLANSGSLLAASQSGAAATKTWISTLDELTRETHAEADGQTVGIDDPFDVGGESAQYPGDPSLSWEESANCRCAIGYGEPLTGSADPFEEALTRAFMAPIPAEVEAVDETGAVPARAHYRPADDPDQACDTCSFYRPADSRCLMFPGDPEVLADYTCDEWVAETSAEGITSGGMATVEIDKLTLSERAKLAADLAEPLTPEAERLARVREALAASGVRDVFDDEELVAVIAAASEVQRPALSPELIDLTLLAATDGGTPWQATLCVAGQPTVDSGTKRLLIRDGGSWLPLPLPLMLMDDGPHADMTTSAPICGRIDQIWWAGNVCQGSGVFFDNSDDPEVAATGSKAAALVSEMRRLGISIDMVDIQVDLVEWRDGTVVEFDFPNDPVADSEDGPYVEPEMGDMPATEESSVDDGWEPPEFVYAFRRWSVSGATICPVQALTQATISLVASLLVDGGRWFAFSEFGDATPPLTASAAGLAPERPPRAWFDEPERDEPTPLTVTDEGQVYGHMALWNSCHTGFAGQCVPPPKSPSDYSGFHLGEIAAADGSRVEVGTLTMDTGHAGKRLNAAAAVAHYDDTGTAAAYVRAKDGRFGIWVAGSLSARLDAADAQALMAAKPSGDWREIFRGMGRDMIGALMVNVPGFPVPRTLTAAGLPYGDASVEFSSDCELCDESLARSLAVLSASVDGVEGLAALVAS